MIRLTRRVAMASAAVLAAAPAFAGEVDVVYWHALADDVRNEMRWAWAEYRRRARGKDEIKPLSGGIHSFPLKNSHVGLSLIEAMDTLWVMGLDAEFADALAWVKAYSRYDIDGEVSVFETSIRLVGGLLSAHHACDDPVLLAKAKDLADRLLPAFDTPTGFPYRYINLKTGARRGQATNPAETGSYLPEYGMLSRLTGDSRYHDAAKRALVAMYQRRSPIGLLADRMDIMTGARLSRRATIAPPSDSYYEYLWDGWQLLGDAECKAMYDSCTVAILKHQVISAQGQTWLVD